MAPSVPPMARKPNSRLPCSSLKRSLMSPQKSDTTERLKTLSQMKNA